MKNFLDAVRARDYRKLNADIAIGARAAALCHLANISQRTGRKLPRFADNREVHRCG